MKNYLMIKNNPKFEYRSILIIVYYLWIINIYIFYHDIQTKRERKWLFDVQKPSSLLKDHDKNIIYGGLTCFHYIKQFEINCVNYCFSRGRGRCVLRIQKSAWTLWGTNIKTLGRERMEWVAKAGKLLFTTNYTVKSWKSSRRSE